MVTQIEGSSANQLFYLIARELLERGHQSSPRGLKTIELDDVWLKLTNPLNSIVTMPERNADVDYLNGEMEWYMSGSLKVEDIGKHSKFWYNIANPDGTVNSNYGHFVYYQQMPNGKSQFDWCVYKLKKDPDTRQALINYNQPLHKYDGNKDFVCTIAQTFRLRDGKLDSNVFMRSNDLWLGLTYDLPWFTGVQKDIARKIDVVPGVYNHYAASLHVYEKHWKDLEAIGKAKRYEP